MFKYLLLFFTILILILYKSDFLFYPIDEISITSNEKKYNEKTINNYLNTLYGKNLLTIDIDKIKETMVSDNWISDAEITKSFPSEISINIIQHTPVAMYNSKIMTLTGSFIDTSGFENNLPIITDHSNDFTSASHILSHSTLYLDKINLKINKIIIHHSLIKIYTSDILLITDKEKFETNIKRLVTSFEKIYEIYKKKITSIDMRYSNGFAIK
tara:strand:- start:6088 stop:6729 length:642 start_codon:yes stop_codon:yes gene_type:complete